MDISGGDIFTGTLIIDLKPDDGVSRADADRIVKNVIKHMVLSLYKSSVYEKCYYKHLNVRYLRFIRTDLPSIDYGPVYGNLECLGYLPVILNKHKEHMASNVDFWRMFDTMSGITSIMALYLENFSDSVYDTDALRKCIDSAREGWDLTKEKCQEILDAVDRIEILRQKSDMPKWI